MVGNVSVLQQIPRSVMTARPSFVTWPVTLTVSCVTLSTATVSDGTRRPVVSRTQRTEKPPLL